MNEYINIMLDDGGVAPTRSHEGDAGLDVYAPRDIVLWPLSCDRINSKIHIEVPVGYVGDVDPRSSLMSRGIFTFGSIDHGYTGEVGIVLFNISQEKVMISKGDRIAQIVLKQIITPKIRIVESLKNTERGDGGFGSTGK